MRVICCLGIGGGVVFLEGEVMKRVRFKGDGEVGGESGAGACCSRDDEGFGLSRARGFVKIVPGDSLGGRERRNPAKSEVFKHEWRAVHYYRENNARKTGKISLTGPAPKGGSRQR